MPRSIAQVFNPELPRPIIEKANRKVRRIVVEPAEGAQVELHPMVQAVPGCAK